VEASGAPEAGEVTTRGRGILRVLAVLVGCLALAVGNPWILVTVPLGLVLTLLPVAHWVPRLVGLVLLGLVLGGVQAPSAQDMDLGWAVLVGGIFVVATLSAPESPFMSRGLVAIAGAAGWSGFILATRGGWAGLEAQVLERVMLASEATAGLTSGWLQSEQGEAIRSVAERTAELQVAFFPAQLALASLLGLAGAWWFFKRLTEGSSGGLGPVSSFRFPDVWIWAVIAGIVLVVLDGWEDGWGRLGANLLVFMGTLYAARGAAVLRVISGGLTFWSALLLVAGLVLAFPVLLAGALLAGLGDTWFDLRSRAARGSAPSSGENS